MQKGIPDESGEYAQEGTMLHDVMVTRNLDGLDSQQKSAINDCIHFLNTFGANKCEQEIKLKIHDNDELLTEGTADVVFPVCANSGGLEIIDWKFGWIPVNNANENIQLASYAVGAMQKYKREECTVHVYQPRIKHKTQYTFKNADAIISNIRKIIATAKQDRMILSAGEKQCRYCLARLECPAFRIKFQKLTASRGCYDLSNPQIISNLYTASLAVKSFIRDIESRLKGFIEKDGACGSWKIESQQGSRQIKDLNTLYDRLADWLTPREFNSVCSVTIGKLETMCVDKIVAEAKAQGEKLSKKDAKAKMQLVVADLISRGNPTKKIMQIT